MVNCYYCDEEIDYLPFKCRYCGKNHCKNHRLPEKHSCSFEFKSIQTLVNPSKTSSKAKYQDYSRQRTSNNVSRRRIRSNYAQPRFSSTFGSTNQISGVKLLIILNTFMFFMTIFIPISFLSLNLYEILRAPYLMYTIFIATIIPAEFLNPLSLINLLFSMIMIFFAGKSIEMRFGRRILLSTYFIGTFITGGGIILLQLLFPYFVFSNFIYYSSMGGVMALITLMGMLNPEAQVTLYLYFIPVRLKMKHIVWIFIGFEIFGIVMGDYIVSPANIVGCLGGLIMLKSIRQQSRPRFT